MSQTWECIIGDKPLVLETGKLAGQADGAVTVRYGDTLVLVTACASNQPREGVDFFPLTVDYEERLYAAGKIPGGFFRREGRPSQDAILLMRLTDRPLRPLFPQDYRNDVQIVITILSADQENEPDVLAIIGASAALMLSDIPFEGPVSAVRLGYIDGQFAINPTFSQLATSTLDLIVASTKEAVVMLEAGAKEVPESLILEATKIGHEINQDIIRLQEKMREALGKPKAKYVSATLPAEVTAAVASALDGKLSAELSKEDIHQREEGLEILKKELVEKLGSTYSKANILSSFEQALKKDFKASVLKKSTRPGGRSFTQLRPISCEVGLLPRAHGSGLFQRGQTQVLSIATLGSMGEEQKLDGLGPEERKRFLHHYNFPPFSTGETKRMTGPGRRETGHGALAERALLPVIPSEEAFPYTIRLVSEVVSSNGSTSMASVCASSLSLMDAGIPIKSPVVGVAMGVITGDNGEYAILTDIEGMEDAYGGMDFKIAGTAAGVTAVQLDIKLKSVSHEILEKAIFQSREARLEILGKIQKTLASSRAELSRYAPRIFKISINPEKIGAVIGPGGRTIRSIIADTKATIDVENDGTVLIGSANEEAAQKAMRIIESLTKDVEVGSTYTGKVTRILPHGAMVEILPGKEGMVHISELADYRVGKVEDEVKLGDEVMVKVIELDRLGRINLSRRAVYEETRPAAPGMKSDSPPRPSATRELDRRPAQRFPFPSRPPRPGEDRRGR